MIYLVIFYILTALINFSNISYFSFSMYSIGLSLIIFHFILTLFLLFRNNFSKTMNEKVWFFKSLLIIALYFFILFFVDYQIYYILLILSIIYVLALNIIVIDIIMTYNERNIEKSGKLLTFSLISDLLFIFFQVITWNNDKDARDSIFLVLFLALYGICLAVVLLRDNRKELIFNFSLIFLFAQLCLTFGLYNSFGNQAHQILSFDEMKYIAYVFYLVLFITSLIYLTNQSFEKLDKNKEIRNEDEDKNESKGLSNYKSNDFIYFHILMIGAVSISIIIFNNFDINEDKLKFKSN